MSLRTRLLIAFAVIVFVPLGLLAFGFRSEVTRRLSEQYERQFDRTRRAVEADLHRDAATIQQQLSSLAAALPDDNRFRAALAGIPAERQYLLDWAGTAMRLTGMVVLQVLDQDGRILSSGHYRNEHGRRVPDLVPALRTGGDQVTLMRVPGVSGDLLALVRHATIGIGDRSLTLVGGVPVDARFLRRLSGDGEAGDESGGAEGIDAIALSLRYAGTVLTADDDRRSAGRRPTEVMDQIAARRTLPLHLVLVGDGGEVAVQEATLDMVQPRTYLVSLLRSVDAWMLGTAAATGALALLLALWLSWRVTRRLAMLADKTAVIDLDRLDVEFDEGTDEVGRLSRVLGDLTARLHAGTARVREAERRATVGDLARQINHDIKNGLIPLRNVMRHLTQVGRDDPSAVAGVLAERRGTIDSSIGYLETLATNYERLSGRPARRECDVHALIADVARAAATRSLIELRTDLSASDASVFGDPIALRRILENLVTNAADSLEGRSGRISLATENIERDDARLLAVTVADTGRGMAPEETAMIFEHFYSTREGGGGLGLSIVRRLVTDLHGSIRAESEPGRGTRMTVEIPTIQSRSGERRDGTPPSRRVSGGRRRW